MRALIEDLSRKRWLSEALSQEKIKRGEVRDKDGGGLDDAGAAKFGLRPDDIIGFFANKHNMASGWLIYEPTSQESAEFGAGAKRIYSAKTQTMSIAKFNLVKGTVAFLDNKAYEDGDVKYQKASPYSRLRIEHTGKAFRSFGIV